MIAEGSSASSARPLDTLSEIETPEHMRFAHQLAGPARRGLALLIDTFVQGALVVVLLLVVMLALAGVMGAKGVTEGAEAIGSTFGLVLVGMFAIQWGYFVACEQLLRGASVGKLALGLRVVRQDGSALRFGDSVLRNLLRAVDMLPSVTGAVGYFAILSDARFRRLGDLVAGTLVIAERRVTAPTALALPPLPPLALASPPLLSRDELDAIELLLRRLPRLHPARAEELAGILAPGLSTRLGATYRSATTFLAQVYEAVRQQSQASHAHRAGEPAPLPSATPGLGSARTAPSSASRTGATERREEPSR